MKKETYKILLHTFTNPHLCESRVVWWVKKQFEMLTIDNVSSHALWFSFIFSFKTLAKVTLTFNHHGLTLYQTTLDVSKLKTFQYWQKILKLWGMLNQIQNPPLQQRKVWRRKLAKYDSLTVYIYAEVE